MNYLDANYLDKETGELHNWYDDMESELVADYRERLAEWKKMWLDDREVKKLFSDKIVELTGNIWEEELYRGEVYRNDEYSDTSKDWAITRSKERAKKLESILRRFTYYRNLCVGKKGKELNIELAKQFPIGDLLPKQRVLNGGNREFYSCPLHSERTASFCWYKKTNTWHCFGGCGLGGDVIDLYMKLNNCDFVTATKALC